MTGDPTFEHSRHLVALIAEVERLATLVDDRETDGPVADDLRAAACVATLRLDGSTIPSPPRPDDLDALRAAAPTVPETKDVGSGTWLDALATYFDLEDADDTRIWTIEYLAAQHALASDDLAKRLTAEFVDVVAELHGRVTRGLVAPDAAGVRRRSALAVQDRSVGRVLYYPSDPDQIERDLHLLAAWVESSAAREHGLVASGVVLYDLLRIHPFLSANGRLARTAARLLLRARGLDPAGLAIAEVALAANPLVSYEQVAKSMRRRDLTIWLETWSEAVAAGLRRSLLALGGLRADVPERATRFVAGRPAGRFTIADYRAEADVGPDDSRTDLQTLLDAGRIERVLGARGLAFTVTTAGV